MQLVVLKFADIGDVLVLPIDRVIFFAAHCLVGELA